MELKHGYVAIIASRNEARSLEHDQQPICTSRRARRGLHTQPWVRSGSERAYNAFDLTYQSEIVTITLSPLVDLVFPSEHIALLQVPVARTTKRRLPGYKAWAINLHLKTPKKRGVYQMKKVIFDNVQHLARTTIL